VISPVSSTSAIPANASQREQLREAAQAFEAIFVRQLLSTARAADFGGDELFGGAGDETFTEMRDAHFADVAAKSDMIGLAAQIEAQLARFTQGAE
jgi:peptidoglycan hydrolase FlgJ